MHAFRENILICLCFGSAWLCGWRWFFLICKKRERLYYYSALL